jgi:hypothetical protein
MSGECYSSQNWATAIDVAPSRLATDSSTAAARSYRAGSMSRPRCAARPSPPAPPRPPSWRCRSPARTPSGRSAAPRPAAAGAAAGSHSARLIIARALPISADLARSSSSAPSAARALPVIPRRAWVASCQDQVNVLPPSRCASTPGSASADRPAPDTTHPPCRPVRAPCRAPCRRSSPCGVPGTTTCATSTSMCRARAAAAAPQPATVQLHEDRAALAAAAAAEAEAATLQGRFCEMHELLFHRQKALEDVQGTLVTVYAAGLPAGGVVWIFGRRNRA